MHIKTERYNGPENPSEHNCQWCNTTLNYRHHNNQQHLNAAQIHNWDTNGVTTTTICFDCFYTHLKLTNQIENYQHTGNPNDTTWDQT